MSRQRIFLSLCGFVFVINLSRIVFAPLLEPLGHEFNVGNDTLGLIVTLVWIGSALPRIPIAYLLTIFRQQQVVLWTGIALSGVSLLTASAQSPLVFAICAFAMGMMSGAYFSAAVPLISDLYPARTGRALGIHGTASQIAAVVAPAIVVGFLILGPWRLVFIGISLMTLVSTITFWHISNGDQSTSEYNLADRDFIGAIKSEYPTILTGFVLLGTTGLVWNGVFNFYPSYMIAEKSVSPNVAPLLLTVVFAAGVPAFWISGMLSDRLPTIPYILSIICSFVLCLYMLIMVEGVLAIILVTIVIGYVIHSIFPAMDVFVFDSIPSEDRTSIYGVYSGTVLLIESMGSFFIGSVTEFGYSYSTVFGALGAGLALVAVCMTVLYAFGKLPSKKPVAYEDRSAGH